MHELSEITGLVAEPLLVDRHRHTVGHVPDELRSERTDWLQTN